MLWNNCIFQFFRGLTPMAMKAYPGKLSSCLKSVKWLYNSLAFSTLSMPGTASRYSFSMYSSKVLYSVIRVTSQTTDGSNRLKNSIVSPTFMFLYIWLYFRPSTVLLPFRILSNHLNGGLLIMGIRCRMPPRRAKYLALYLWYLFWWLMVNIWIKRRLSRTSK